MLGFSFVTAHAQGAIIQLFTDLRKLATTRDRGLTDWTMSNSRMPMGHWFWPEGAGHFAQLSRIAGTGGAPRSGGGWH